MKQKIIQTFKLIQLAFVEELRRIVRDPGIMLIIFFAVIAYPVVYSIAYKNNVVRDIPVAVVNLDHSALSRQTQRMINATPELRIVAQPGSLKEAQKMFWDGKVNGILLIPANYSKNVMHQEQTSVSVYCDASYFLMYKETLTGTLQAIETVSAGIEVKRLMAEGIPLENAKNLREPLQVNIYELFNPSGAYGSYVMPGIIIVIIQQTLLVGIGMAGGARRESKYGMLSSINLSNHKTYYPVVLGKSFAYFGLYLVNFTVTLIWIYHWFEFPQNAGFFSISALIIPFIFAVIFLGIGISQVFKRREHSIMFLVFLSPLVLFLSGVSWPASQIPKALYYVAHVFPTNFMVPAFIRVRTMGVELNDVSLEWWGMIIQMIIYFIFAVQMMKITDRKIVNRAV